MKEKRSIYTGRENGKKNGEESKELRASKATPFSPGVVLHGNSLPLRPR